MDSSIFVKDNILFLDVGYLISGDINEIKSEFQKSVNKLQKPFESVVDFSRMIDTASLIHPDDIENTKELIDLLNVSGRDLAVWIIDENSILFCQLKKLTLGKFDSIEVCDSVDNAIEIIGKFRSDRGS